MISVSVGEGSGLGVVWGVMELEGLSVWEVDE